jgi:hypothetical protein
MVKKSTTFKGQAKPYGKSGHFNESRRHSLQARGIKTGHFILSYAQAERMGLKPYDGMIGTVYNPKEKKIVGYAQGHTFDKKGISELSPELKTFVFVTPKGEEITVRATNRDNALKSIGYGDKYEEEWGDFSGIIAGYKKGDVELYEKRTSYITKTHKKLKDTDKDSVPDKLDCDPLDPTKQDTPKEIEKKVETERDYIKSLNKNWLSPDEQEILKKKMGGELTNEMRSQLEVHQFKQDPPERYFAYVNLDKKQITTWTGEKLGDITHVGNEWSSNMGDRRVPIRVKGINGFTYSGTFYKDAGDYARLKKVMGD